MRPNSVPAAIWVAFITLIGLTPLAWAEPVHLVLLSPPTQTAAPGGILPSTFSVRVERATGEPVPGVRLGFGDNVSSCWIPGPPDQICPEDHWYGEFEVDGVPTPSGAYAISGPDGIATAPAAYRLGHPLGRYLPFVYEVFPYASTQTTPGGFTITLEEALNPIGGLLAGATSVVVWGEATAPVPALGTTALVALALLLAGASVWRLRRGGVGW